MYETFRPYLAARRYLLISHVAPDGDAIGSLLGLTWLLEAQGKEVAPVSQDGVPVPLRYLPGADKITRKAQDNDFDVVISLDASDPDRLGAAYQPGLHRKLPLVNIDHHITNLHFGVTNIVDSQAASTAEIIFHLAQALQWPIGPEAAQCLLTGIVTDTRGFRTSNVTPAVFGIAQQLMEAGASLIAVNENVLNHRTFGSICLWGKALNHVRLQDRIIWTTIPLTMRPDCDNAEQNDSGLTSYLVEAEEADMSAVFSEREDGYVDVGMRAKPGFDVAQVALSLGGGGHPQAAGCRLHASLDEAEDILIPALRAALTEQRTRR